MLSKLAWFSRGGKLPIFNMLRSTAFEVWGARFVSNWFRFCSPGGVYSLGGSGGGDSPPGLWVALSCPMAAVGVELLWSDVPLALTLALVPLLPVLVLVNVLLLVLEWVVPVFKVSDGETDDGDVETTISIPWSTWRDVYSPKESLSIPLSSFEASFESICCCVSPLGDSELEKDPHSILGIVFILVALIFNKLSSSISKLSGIRPLVRALRDIWISSPCWSSFCTWPFGTGGDDWSLGLCLRCRRGDWEGDSSPVAPCMISPRRPAGGRFNLGELFREPETYTEDTNSISTKS